MDSTLCLCVWIRAMRIAFSTASAPPLVKKTFAIFGPASSTMRLAASPRLSFACCGAIVDNFPACS